MQVPSAEIGSVFIILPEHVKNGESRLVVLNQAARAVIERQRGNHSEFFLSLEADRFTTCLTMVGGRQENSLI